MEKIISHPLFVIAIFIILINFENIFTLQGISWSIILIQITFALCLYFVNFRKLTKMDKNNSAFNLNPAITTIVIICLINLEIFTNQTFNILKIGSSILLAVTIMYIFYPVWNRKVWKK